MSRPAVPRRVPPCPLCDAALEALSSTCPACSGDLRSLLRLASMADSHFNQGLRAARDGDWDSAAERLSVTVALCPDDVEALILLGKVRFRQRRKTLALETWQRALKLDPDNVAAREAILAAEGPDALHDP